MEIKKMKNSKKSNILPNIPAFCASVYGQLRLPLFVDIETTGFSGARNRLCLIGTACLQNGSLVTEQFFAESPQEEAALIAAFDHLAEQFETVVTYCGNRFDLPFLEKCRKRLGIQSQTNRQKQYIDLYTLAHSYRHLFGLANYRQKTVESFLGIQRNDLLDSSEIVTAYESYQKQPQEHLLAQILLHNEADLIGMVQLLSLYAFERFLQGGFTIEQASVSAYRKMDGTQGSELCISCRILEPLPAAFSCKNDLFYVNAVKSRADFRIPLYSGTLKYFYPNYKDYYYFPEEDTAIHKSVARYADPAHRLKAKAATCYSKKAGMFLPQYEEVITPAFYTEYQAPVSYFEWNEGCAHDEPLMHYCKHILQVLKTGK